MCCRAVGQGAAPPVIPDFSLLYESSPACLGSSKSFLPLPPLLSWFSLGSAGWDLAFTQHHQRAPIEQLFWQGGTSPPQSPANPAANVPAQRVCTVDSAEQDLTSCSPKAPAVTRGSQPLKKSYKQGYNHQWESISPGKPLDLGRFAPGCEVSHGQTVDLSVPAVPSLCRAGLTLPISWAVSGLWLRLPAWKTLTQSYSNCSFAPS